MTRHAEIRARQRGFGRDMIEFIQLYGRSDTAPGGVEKVWIGDREAIELHRLIERCSGRILIIDGGVVITAEKTYQHKKVGMRMHRKRRLNG